MENGADCLFPLPSVNTDLSPALLKSMATEGGITLPIEARTLQPGGSPDTDTVTVQFFKDAGVPGAQAEHYAQMFYQHEVTLPLLNLLTPDLLGSIGITKVGHQLMILSRAAKLTMAASQAYSRRPAGSKGAAQLGRAPPSAGSLAIQPPSAPAPAPIPLTAPAPTPAMASAMSDSEQLLQALQHIPAAELSNDLAALLLGTAPTPPSSIWEAAGQALSQPLAPMPPVPAQAAADPFLHMDLSGIAVVSASLPLMAEEGADRARIINEHTQEWLKMFSLSLFELKARLSNSWLSAWTTQASILRQHLVRTIPNT